MALASSFGFFGGTRSPVLLWVIISGIPPTFVATIGIPQAIPSIITRPNPSKTDGTTSTSAQAINFGISELGTSPIKKMSFMLFNPSSLAKSMSPASCGPVPTIMQVKSGSSFFTYGRALIRY